MSGPSSKGFQEDPLRQPGVCRSRRWNRMGPVRPSRPRSGHRPQPAVPTTRFHLGPSPQPRNETSDVNQTEHARHEFPAEFRRTEPTTVHAVDPRSRDACLGTWSESFIGSPGAHAASVEPTARPHSAPLWTPLSRGVDKKGSWLTNTHALAETGNERWPPLLPLWGLSFVLSLFTPSCRLCRKRELVCRGLMTEKSRQLAEALSHLDQCNRDLRSVMQRFEKTTTKLARRVESGALVVEAIRSVTGSVQLRELNETEKAFEVARRRPRSDLALAMEQGTNLSEMGRALGISRQLSSRLGAEAGGPSAT